MIFKLKESLPVWFSKLFFFLFLLHSPLFSQFAGYSQAESGSYNAALFSNGTGLRDPMANLSGNPAFLVSHGKNLAEVGGMGMTARQTPGPIVLNGGGFYQISESLGIGVRFKPVYTRFFPADERLINYTGQTVLSYKVHGSIFLGAGLGPTVSTRLGGYSTYSWNAFASIGIFFKKITLGLLAESPGGNRFNNYLGTESLKERYPEKISLGMQYDVHPSIFLYGELVRTFWERAMFSQNGLEEKPPFPIRTTYSGSFGFGYHVLQGLDVLLGVSKLYHAANNGSLDPVYGLSAGIKSEILPSVFGAGLLGSLYMQRTGIRKTLEAYEPETRFGFQIQSQFEIAKSDITMPKN